MICLSSPALDLRTPTVHILLFLTPSNHLTFCYAHAPVRKLSLGHPSKQPAYSSAARCPRA